MLREPALLCHVLRRTVAPANLDELSLYALVSAEVCAETALAFAYLVHSDLLTLEVILPLDQLWGMRHATIGAQRRSRFERQSQMHPHGRTLRAWGRESPRVEL